MTNNAATMPNRQLQWLVKINQKVTCIILSSADNCDAIIFRLTKQTFSFRNYSRVGKCLKYHNLFRIIGAGFTRRIPFLSPKNSVKAVITTVTTSFNLGTLAIKFNKISSLPSYKFELNLSIKLVRSHYARIRA